MNLYHWALFYELLRLLLQLLLLLMTLLLLLLLRLWLRLLLLMVMLLRSFEVFFFILVAFSRKEVILLGSASL